jgi:hypothetical protein
MMELIHNIKTAFDSIFSKVTCNSDFYYLPTYWHTEYGPCLVRKNKVTAVLVLHKKGYEFPLTSTLKDKMSVEEIEKQLRVDFDL